LEAILILLAAFGLMFSNAFADPPLIRVDLESQAAYIVPEGYATARKADFQSSIPGPVKIDGFWTPPAQDVAVADRVFGELIRAAVKNPALLFPDLAPNPDRTVPVNPEVAKQLEEERNELALISKNFDAYARQYAGIIVGGQKLVFCNYSTGTRADPSAGYLFIDKVFVPDGTVRFLQCQFKPIEKTCSNVSMFGSWQPPEK
jgi:hypothetical protein